MERTPTVSSRTSPLTILKQLSPTVQRSLIFVVFVLAALAAGLGIYSVTKTTSPIDSATPKMLVHTTSLSGPLTHPA